MSYLDEGVPFALVDTDGPLSVPESTLLPENKFINLLIY